MTAPVSGVDIDDIPGATFDIFDENKREFVRSKDAKLVIYVEVDPTQLIQQSI